MVGAPYDGAGSSQTGSVYIYREVSENNWQLVERVKPPDVNGQFGYSVDIDANSTIVVGAWVSGKSCQIEDTHRVAIFNQSTTKIALLY